MATASAYVRLAAGMTASGAGVPSGGPDTGSCCPGTSSTCPRAASPADVLDSSLWEAQMPSMTQGRFCGFLYKNILCKFSHKNYTGITCTGIFRSPSQNLCLLLIFNKSFYRLKYFFFFFLISLLTFSIFLMFLINIIHLRPSQKKNCLYNPLYSTPHLLIQYGIAKL